MGSGQSRPPPPAPSPASTSPLKTAAPRKNFGRRYSRKFSHIADQYQDLDQVQNALRQAGLESSNLIVGIDFTKSNEWTGKHSFNGRSLHAIGNQPNPYEQAISIIGRTLSVFDEDNLIPCFGFGDASTHDQYVFSFYEDHHPCIGFDDALTRYRQIVPNLKLAGPTSFAPIVQAAISTVEESGGQYHVLVIIADGQVTRSVDTGPGNLSPQEKATIDAIVAASDYPLSIILVGVGDGPWDMMREFDDNIPSRSFDNFQFVNFSEIMARNMALQQKEARFALSALMEIPSQYKATVEFELLGQQTGFRSSKAPLPPPQAVLQADRHARGYSHSGSFADTSGFQQRTSTPPGRSQYPPVSKYSADVLDYGAQAPQHYPPPMAYPPPPTTYPPSSAHGSSDQSRHATTSRDVNNENQQLCPVCMNEKRDMAFGCGHQTCRDCAKDLQSCPICREKISTRLRLYN